MAEGTTLAVGSVLAGRYRLEKVIGAGGMATVWRAEDQNLGRSVAIKALSETLLADPAYVARFEREARIAAGLLHPHLVKVFDYGSGEGRPYLVMEYVEGPTLAALIARDDPSIDPDRLASELLDALGQIHAAGVVHRDIKPANVLIDSAGTAKLTDFGIARPADATQLTQTGQVIGTLAYMAPEVKEGREADERSDLYSLGVLLRECAKGGASAALAALIERLTAPAPEERPASAEEALQSLDRARRSETTEPTVPMAAPAGVAAAGAGAAETAPMPATAPRLRRREALAAALALAAAAAVILLVALDSGDGGESASTAGAKRDGAPAKQQASNDTTEQPATPPPSPSPEPESTVPCNEVETRKDALEEERKAAIEAAGDDEEAKKQLEASFKQQEEALKQREEACHEAGKEAEEESEEGGPPGKEKIPPGQAKKGED